MNNLFCIFIDGNFKSKLNVTGKFNLPKHKWGRIPRIISTLKMSAMIFEGNQNVCIRTQNFGSDCPQTTKSN